MKPTMTYAIARAYGWECAQKQMRKAGRTAWNDEDYQLATDTLNRLWPLSREQKLWQQLEKKRTAQDN